MRENISISHFFSFSSFLIFSFSLGSGFTKACTSAFLGEQFAPHQAEKRSRWYSWYYLSIQFAVIAVSIGGPIIIEQQGWGPWGLFVILSASFPIFFPIFLANYRNFRKRAPQGSVYKTFFLILFSCCRNRKRERKGPSMIDNAKYEFEDEQVEDVKSVLSVLVVFTPLPLFWAIFFQMYSVWIAQAKSMNSNLGSFFLPPATTVTLNPIFDVFLIPLFASVLYPVVGKCIKVTPLRKMAMGLLFTIASLVTAGFVEIAIYNAKSELSVFWMVPQYFLVSVAEILLSVTVYEFAYTEAPASMKGLVTGCMFFTIALGNGLLAALQLIKTDKRFILNFSFAGAVAVIFVIFLFIAKNYEYRVEHEEGDVITTVDNDDLK